MFRNPTAETSPSVAYFSMEFGLSDKIKSYAGGLGILAGDTAKTAADLGMDFVGITLLYKKGYFKQVLTDKGEQLEHDDEWDYSTVLVDTGKKIGLKLVSETIYAKIWKLEVVGVHKHKIPILFLDADIEDNSIENRAISYNLYTPDENIRLKQEILLGIGGVRALLELGYEIFDNYHLNESHAAFSIVELNQILKGEEEVRKRIVFTCHTPEEHGHKIYPLAVLAQHFNDGQLDMLKENSVNESVHMTKFCFRYSKFRNAVSKRHKEITSKMFPNYEIDYVTNGVHTASWAGRGTEDLFDKYIPGWQSNPSSLIDAQRIPEEEMLQTFTENKKELVNFIEDRYDISLNLNVFTIGFGRRVDVYKRSNFIFSNLDRLKEIAKKFNGLQIILSGKAYFNHLASEEWITKIFELSQMDLGALNIIFLEGYDMNISKMMVQGCDLWLNNPIKPREASGTSGMKAALNGVPSFSTIDGWWVEGLKEGITGWGIGTDKPEPDHEGFELQDLYSKLENIIMPLYQLNKKDWAKIMLNSIAYNGSYFNTHRMLREYIEKAYKKNLRT